MFIFVGLVAVISELKCLIKIQLNSDVYKTSGENSAFVFKEDKFCCFFLGLCMKVSNTTVIKTFM